MDVNSEYLFSGHFKKVLPQVMESIEQIHQEYHFKPFFIGVSVDLESRMHYYGQYQDYELIYALYYTKSISNAQKMQDYIIAHYKQLESFPHEIILNKRPTKVKESIYDETRYVYLLI